MARYEQSSISMPQVGSIQPVQTQAPKQLDLLSKDVNKLLGGLDATNQSIYKASEYATELSAVDNANITATGFQKIYDIVIGSKLEKGEQPTSDDYKAMIEWRTKFMQDRLTTVLGDDETQNEIYKQKFYTPTKELLDKLNQQDLTNFQQAFKVEQYEATTKEIAENKYGLTPELLAVKAKYLETLGIKDASKKLYDTVATSAIESFKGTDYNHVSDMVLHGKVKELLGETMFSRYLEYDKDGNLVSKKGVDDTASIRMKNAFMTAISGIKHAQSKAKQTITEVNSSLNYYNLPDSYKKSIEEASKQLKFFNTLCEQGDSHACSQLDNGLRAYNDIKTKYAISLKLAGIYADYKHGNDILEKREFTVPVYNAYGIPTTTKVMSLSVDEQAEYISTYATNGYKDAIKNGDINEATNSLSSLARLEREGLVKGGEASAVLRTIKSPDRFSLYVSKAKSIEEIQALLQSAYAYKSAYNMDMPHVSNRIIARINDYDNQQMKLVSEGKKDAYGKPLTEQTVLENTKLLYGAYAQSTATFNEEERARIGAILGVGRNDAITSDDLDDLVSGIFKFGTVEYGDNTLSTLIQLAVSNGYIHNREELENFAQSKLVRIDSTNLPIWGKQLAIINPTGLKEEKFKEHIVDLLEYNLSVFSDAKELDMSELKDRDHFNIKQQRHYNSHTGNYEVVTIVDVKTDTGGIHSIVLTPYDIVRGVSDKEKASIKDIFKHNRELPKTAGGSLYKD